MSATPNNAGWNAPFAGIDMSDPGGTEAGGGQDALQALLAFACVHAQAARRKQLKDSGISAAIPKEEEFELDEVLRLVAARALSITGADGVAVALAEENAIVCRASAGSIAPDPGVRIDLNSGFSGACLRGGQTVRCDDSDTDDRVNAQACRLLGTRSMIAVPLVAKRRVVGLIEAFSSEPFGFNDSDVKSLILLGELILAAIRPEEEDRLAELSTKIAPEAVLPLAPAKIIVDEKFAPNPVLEKIAPVELVANAITPVASAVAALPEPESRILPVIQSQLEIGAEPREWPAIPRILLLAVLVLIALGLGWADWWKIRHPQESISANMRSPSAAKPEANLREPTSANISPEVKAGATPRVTGIRHWSSAESSTVVVDLEDQVQYEAQRLDNPARIYFDLHDTKMSAGLLNQSIAVDDAFLKRLRMAQPTPNITRVVLETKGEAGFSVKLDSNPYRLTIEVHKRDTTAAPASLNKPSPAIQVAPKKKTPLSQLSGGPEEFRIVLDAGHGGWDLGTVGRKGLLEKDLVLDIVQRLGKLVESKMGAQVLYTRQDDSYLPLEKRAEVANLAKANLFVSVHANYSDLATARGVETYYTNTYSSVRARSVDSDASIKNLDWTGVDIRGKVTGSHQLATTVQQALYGGLAARNPDIRNRGVKEAQYVVLTGTQMPAVLAEVSFVSSPADEDRLQSSEYRQQIAEALYKGVAKYREDQRTKLASAKK